MNVNAACEKGCLVGCCIATLCAAIVTVSGTVWLVVKIYESL